jgi:uncharacterized protein
MNRIQRLIELVRPYYKTIDPAHDWAHIGRVAATARKLAEDTPAHLECVLAAVYGHDLVNLPKDHPDRSRASVMSADAVEPLLREVGFEDQEVALIKTAIIEHSFSRGSKPSCVESEIVQDADRLDALGAIGVLRCAAVNAKLGSSFYEPLDPLAQERELDDRKYMVDHYFVKLFKLPGLMNTIAGRELAHRRVKSMEAFLKTLVSEIRGKD